MKNQDLISLPCKFVCHIPDGYDQMKSICVEGAQAILLIGSEVPPMIMGVDSEGIKRWGSVPQVLDLTVFPPEKEDPFAELKAAQKAGKTIQSCLAPENPHWIDFKTIPVWDAPISCYRIKPEPPPRQPYSQESWAGRWVKDDDTNVRYSVLEVHHHGIQINRLFLTWETLLIEGWTFSDKPNGIFYPCYR